MAHVCLEGGSQLRKFSQLGLFCLCSYALGIPQLILQLRNGTRVLGSGFTVAKIFAVGSLLVMNFFRRRTPFSQDDSLA